MKNLVLILIVSLTLTGCTNMDRSRESYIPVPSLSQENPTLPCISPELPSVSPQTPCISPQTKALLDSVKNGNQNAKNPIGANTGSVAVMLDIKADTTALYQNSKRGINVELPYNAKWGGLNFAPIDPTWDGGSFVVFGNIGIYGETYKPIRQYTMEFIPYKNSRETLADIMSKSGDLALEKDPELKMINNTETVEYTSNGMCGYPTIIVIGKKYNYKLYPTCPMNIMEDFDVLRTVAKSIKFIDYGTGVTFESKTYGFRFNLPESWKDYSAISNGKIVEFFLPTEDKDWISGSDGWNMAPIIRIGLSTPEEWSNSIKECEAMSPEDYGFPSCNRESMEKLIIGKTQKYIVTYGHAQDAPNDIGKYTSDGKIDYLSHIRSTFKEIR